jgi:hypothetical protein
MDNDKRRQANPAQSFLGVSPIERASVAVHGYPSVAMPNFCRQRVDPCQHSTCALSHQTRCRIALVVVCLLTNCVAEEDNEFDFGGGEMRRDSSCEVAVIAIFSFAFAVVVSLATVAIAYFSAIEGALLRRYLDKGVHIPAKVVCASLVRLTQDGAEYSVTTEYRYNMNDDGDDVSGTYKYAAVLRKQLRCLECDIYQHSSAVATSKTQSATPTRNRLVCIEVVPQAPDTPTSRPLDSATTTAQKGATDQLNAFPSFDMAFFEAPQPHHYVEILVLPGHPHSAIVCKHVERAVQAGNRQCSTVGLIASLSALTLLGVYVGFDNAIKWTAQRESNDSNGALTSRSDATLLWGSSISVTLGMLGLGLLAVHCIGRNAFLEAIYQDYLHHNGAIELKTDDETLYTISTGATASWKTATRASPMRSVDKYLSLESLTL